MSEFGIRVKATLTRAETTSAGHSNAYMQAVENLNRSVQEASRHYDELARQAAYGREDGGAAASAPEEEGEKLERIASVYDEDATPDYSVDGQVRIGHTKFDISGPDYVIGEAFEIRPMPISAVTKPQRNVTLVGDVICYESEAARGGESYRATFGLTDVDREGTFIHVTGEKVAYTNWNAGEPNNSGGGEDFVQFAAGGKWNDIAWKNCFICEWDYWQISG